MFVRFRQTRRLQVSLIETRRVAGRVRQEHVASLGAVDVPPSIADRTAFWQGLHARLGMLSNRIEATMQGKILGEVHARIPMVTIDELRALQLENTEADARFWAGLRDMHQATADDHKQLAATIERTIATAAAGAEMSNANSEAAKDRVARIKRGESVAGGLGKPLTREDLIRILREAGWTTKKIERADMLHTISQLGGFEEVLAEIGEAHDRAEHAAVRRVLRRRLRLAGLPSDGG
jgi:hypothetical protein